MKNIYLITIIIFIVRLDSFSNAQTIDKTNPYNYFFNQSVDSGFDWSDSNIDDFFKNIQSIPCYCPPTISNIEYYHSYIYDFITLVELFVLFGIFLMVWIFFCPEEAFQCPLLKKYFCNGRERDCVPSNPLLI